MNQTASPLSDSDSSSYAVRAMDQHNSDLLRFDYRGVEIGLASERATFRHGFVRFIPLPDRNFVVVAGQINQRDRAFSIAKEFMAGQCEFLFRQLHSLENVFGTMNALISSSYGIDCLSLVGVLVDLDSTTLHSISAGNGMRLTIRSADGVSVPREEAHPPLGSIPSYVYKRSCQIVSAGSQAAIRTRAAAAQVLATMNF